MAQQKRAMNNYHDSGKWLCSMLCELCHLLLPRTRSRYCGCTLTWNGCFQVPSGGGTFFDTTGLIHLVDPDPRRWRLVFGFYPVKLIFSSRCSNFLTSRITESSHECFQNSAREFPFRLARNVLGEVSAIARVRQVKVFLWSITAGIIIIGIWTRSEYLIRVRTLIWMPIN